MSNVIHNADLGHQCARCTHSFPRMYRHDDGLIYCTPDATCRVQRAAKAPVQTPVQKGKRKATKEARKTPTRAAGKRRAKK